MKVRVPIMVKDPALRRGGPAGTVTENVDLVEQFFLPGPVSRRVAVLDFDPLTGDLRPGVPFDPPAKGRRMGHYRIERPGDIYDPAFIAVSVFGAVLKTMYMFEERDTLGRPLRWAFDAPQLLIVPRAGQMRNAYYQRESHSLQFFYCPDEQHPGQIVYTALARDIVAHETAHAILDGIAPSLWNAVSPQSQALHEAVADLTALLMAFRSPVLRDLVLEQTGGSIRDTSAFSAIAEEVGLAHGHGPLRSLLNNKTLADVDRHEPHQLSQVLTGALYALMVRMHEQEKRAAAIPDPASGAASDAALGPGEETRAAKRALALAAERFKRIIYRALDYLPPGEVSFADFTRAIIAADQVSHPDRSLERDWLRDEALARGLVSGPAALDVSTDRHAPLDVDVPVLVQSDWAAYAFADRYRRLLGIPPGIGFHVEPRLDVVKQSYRHGQPQTVRECIMKVWWSREEPSGLGRGYPPVRAVAVGTTLALDWVSGAVRVLLTSDHGGEGRKDERNAGAGPGGAPQQALARGGLLDEHAQGLDGRDGYLRRLADQGLLLVADEALRPDRLPLADVAVAEVSGGVMRVRGAGRLLHMVRR